MGGGKRSSWGALRGLDQELILDEGAAEATIEEGGQEEHVPRPTQSRHATRASRGTVNHNVNYSTKLHPMDFVTRPNSKEVLRQTSNSVSHATPEHGDESTSLSSPPLTDAESHSEASQVEENHRVLTPRTPHPRAVRHSSRKEARTAVMYSSKHHPQDFALPGYKHRAIINPRKRSKPAATEEQHDSPDEIPAKAPRRARKRLKSLGREHAKPQAEAAQKRGRPPKSVKVRPRWRAASTSSDIDELVDNVIAASQLRRRVEVLNSESTSDESVISARLAEFRDHVNPSLSQPEASSVTLTGVSDGSIIPEYIRDRMALKGYDVDSVTNVTLLHEMLLDYRCHEGTELQIYRPYEATDHMPSQFEDEMAITESCSKVQHPFWSTHTTTASQ
ncbi:hypothetical protein AC579_1862 [Pseudocercospora musae]|uniref:Uncharacterized protein n=1 Tax=Pseudocercospora musae TaxID=113226 RepID=A0A139IBG3_9PEZI|nr:hypothetical protein AC579_1862 [Pseudocercospora musae]